MSNDSQIKAAHISGRYLILATIIGGLFGIGITLSITLSFEPKKEIVYLDRYDETVNLGVNKIIPKKSLKPLNPEYRKLIEQKIKQKNIEYIDHQFKDTDIKIRFFILEFTPQIHRRTKILAMALDGSKNEMLLKPGEIWKVKSGYELTIQYMWIDNEQTFLAVRLYQQKQKPHPA